MKPLYIFELVLLAALWGASFLFMRVATPEFGPIALIELRTGIAALFLLPVVLMAKKSALLIPNAGKLFLVGALGTGIPFALLSYVTLYVTAGYAAILNATAPIFTALLAWLWIKERLTTSAMIGLFVGFVGVILLVFDKQGGGEITLLPVIAGLAACFCYGFGANYTKQKLQHIHPLVLACGSQFGAAFFLLPFSFWYWPQQTPSSDAWIAVIILAVACTSFALVLYFRLIANVGVNKAISVTYLIPFFGVLWGMVFLDESLSLIMLGGGLLILAGVGLTTGVLNRKR